MAAYESRLSLVGSERDIRDRPRDEYTEVIKASPASVEVPAITSASTRRQPETPTE